MPEAISLVWQLIKDKKVKNVDKKKTLLDFDRVLGVNLSKVKKITIPSSVEKLVVQREEYRRQEEWQKADEIRKKIKKLGYKIEDTKVGPKIKTFR